MNTCIKLSTLSCLSTLALSGLMTTAGHAQDTPLPATSLDAAVRQAIDSNPDVTVRLNAMRAAQHEVRFARGAYLPRVDLAGDVGRESNRITSQSPESQSFGRSGLALSATQILWDGLATKNEVERLDHAVQTRYFEFQSAAEDAALEATKAYLDVLRYRELVKLAEDNYVQHKYVADQLQIKKNAGVGRGVDMEQANARVALAQSNLTTEVANLHDVSVRFLRVVGSAPASSLAPATSLQADLGRNQAELIAQALAGNPAISAAIENLRAAQADAHGKESAYQPKIEARLRSGVGNNFDGQRDEKRDTTAELVLNWNLFNGGSDQARVRQYASLIDQAADQRDKACRDVRQTAAIAYNDILKLKDQLASLDRNVLAIEKARDAYRQQFDIGQRSLLDLLNAENELYTAKRSYANAESDMLIAEARTLAARHSLISQLGLASATDGASPDGIQGWQAGPDAAQRCPAVAIDTDVTPMAQLDERASKQGIVAPPPVATTPDTAPESNTSAVNARLAAWAQAWMAKDYPRYEGFYHEGFAPAHGSHAQWVKERQRLLGKEGAINVQIEDLKLTPRGNTVVSTFTQRYTSSNFQDVSQKVLSWRQEAGQWVIYQETNR